MSRQRTVSTIINPQDRIGFSPAVVIGLLAAAVSSAILFRAGLIWLGLVCIGGLVAVGSLRSPDQGRYWLAVLLLTIPLKMGKIFSEPVEVQRFVHEYGFPPGALPVANLLLTDLPFLVLLALFVVSVAREGKRGRGHAIHLVALTAYGWTVLSAYQAEHLDAAAWELVRLLQYFLIYVLAYSYLRSRADLRTVLYASAAALAFQSLYCVGQFFFDLNTLLFGSEATTSSNPELFGSGVMMAGESGLLANMRRGTGTVGHANQTAQYFELWIPFIVAAGFVARSKGLRIVMLGVFLLTGVGLVFTFSRGGAVGMAIALAATALALRHGNHIGRRQFRLFVGVVLLAGVSFMPGLYFYMTARPQMFEDRFWLMEVAWNMTSDNPLLGVGVNQSMAHFNDYDPKRTGTPERLHTYYLSLAAERGLPGVLLFVLFYGLVVREAWRNCRAPDPAAGLMAAGAFGSLLAVGVHMTFDLFYAPPSQWSIWFIAGMAVTLGRLRPQPSADSLAEPAARRTIG